MNTSNHDLSSSKKRAKLPVRKEPYWQKIDRGISLGYRRNEISGTWIVRYWVHSGKRIEKTIGDSTSEYQSALSLALKQASAPSHTPEIKLQEVFKAYLAYVSEQCAQSTARDTAYRIKAHILPSLGGIRLKRLTTKQLIDWRSDLLKGKTDPEELRRAKDTANRVTTILKAALNRAFQQGLCESDSSWRRLKPYPMTGRSREGFLTEEQASKLVAYSEGRLKDLVSAALLTGCRFGELQALKGCDFDPLNTCIHIRRGKTGPRQVFLTKEGAKFFANLTPKRHDAPLLVNQDHEPWTKAQQARALRKALKVSGLPQITFYELRHTYASIALERGINHQILAENMGTSIRMLEKHYGKFMQDARKAQIAAHGPRIGST